MGTIGSDKIKITAPNGESKTWKIDAPYALNPLSRKGEFGKRGKTEDRLTAKDMNRWLAEQVALITGQELSLPTVGDDGVVTRPE